MPQIIEVKIQGSQAIVRKVLSYPSKRYALTTDGEWAYVPEGHPYPERCILPVIHTETAPWQCLSSESVAQV